MSSTRNDRLSHLKNKLSDEQFTLVRDLFSEQDAEWQKKLNSIPVIAPLLGAFGLVSTFYGFEKILDRTFLVDHPVILLLTGILLLFVTGVFYRKL